MVKEGKQTFRFDTFGDGAFWGDTLHHHEAIQGACFGGVGPGVSPRTRVAVRQSSAISGPHQKLKTEIPDYGSHLPEYKQPIARNSAEFRIAVVVLH